MVLLEGTVFGEIKDSFSVLDLRVTVLPLNSLHQRLSHLTFEDFYPLIEIKSSKLQNKESLTQEKFLPLIIRERDTEYQFSRIILYHRLLLVN